MLDSQFLDTQLTLKQLGVTASDQLQFPFPLPADLYPGANWLVRPYQVPGKKRANNIKNVIAVASGKGGVGKSMVAVNLAVALGKLGAKVGLLDGDIYGPSIPTMLGAGRAPAKDGKIKPLNLHGIKAVSMGYLVDEKTPMVWRGPMASGALMQMFNDTDWGELDYLVIDLPPGTGDVQLTLAQKLPVTGALVVTTPQDVALADVNRALVMLEKVSVPVLGVVENMSTFACTNCNHENHIFGKLPAVPFANTDVQVIASLPLDIKLRQSADGAKPAALEDKQFEKLALKALARLALRPRDLTVAIKEHA